MKKDKKIEGFSLISVVLTVSAIAIIATAFIILFSPGEKMAETRDAIRETNINQIQKTVYVYCIEEQTAVPSAYCYQEILNIPNIEEEGLKEICNSSNFTQEECQEADLVDLSLLTPKYFYSIPIDPLNSTQDIGTGYFIGYPPVTVFADKAEMRSPIIVGMSFVEHKEIEEKWKCGDDMIDERDNKTYSTVKIGEQCWMAENLSFDSGCKSVTWVNGSDRGWCGCYDNQEENCNTFGLLYQWSAVMAGSQEEGAVGLCPEGWHVPTDTDWHHLEDELSTGICLPTRTNWGCDPAGEKMKTSTWGGDNSSSFTALPAGFRSSNGAFHFTNTDTYFRSSSGNNAFGWTRNITHNMSTVYRYLTNKVKAQSVRCLKSI